MTDFQCFLQGQGLSYLDLEGKNHLFCSDECVQTQRKKEEDVKKRRDELERMRQLDTVCVESEQANNGQVDSEQVESAQTEKEIKHVNDSVEKVEISATPRSFIANDLDELPPDAWSSSSRKSLNRSIMDIWNMEINL